MKSDWIEHKQLAEEHLWIVLRRWGETADGLGSMFSEDEEVKEFIINSKDSDFLSLKNGNFIFRCSPRKTINYPAPRPLFDVLDSAGLLDG